MVTPPPEQALTPEFERRRTLNWLVLGLLYAFFYMSRYNWSVTGPTIQKFFGWQTHTELGYFEAMLPWVYGLAVVFNGPLADRIGGRKAFLIGAVGVVVMNALMGCAYFAVMTPAVWLGTGKSAQFVHAAVMRPGVTSGGLLTFMLAAWGLNGFFQSFGALSIVKVNSQWFHMRERGTFAGVFGVLILLGLLLAFQGVPLILQHRPWPWAFWIPGACVAVFFVINAIAMRESPHQAGLGHFDTGDEAVGDDRPAPFLEVLKRIYTSRATLTIALASMMIGFVRRSVVDAWWPQYFTEFHNAPLNFAHFPAYEVATWGIALAGIAGGFAFGITSDRRFATRRAPVITMGFLGMAATLALLGMSDRMGWGPLAAACWITVLSFFVNGAHGMIGGAASMDFGGRKASATAAGMFDGMQYLAGGFVGIGMSQLLDIGHGAKGPANWDAWHWAPIPFALVGAVLMATLWNVVPRRHGAPETSVAPANVAAAES